MRTSVKLEVAESGKWATDLVFDDGLSAALEPTLQRFDVLERQRAHFSFFITPQCELAMTFRRSKARWRVSFLKGVGDECSVRLGPGSGAAIFV